MAAQSNDQNPKKFTLINFQGFICPTEFVPNIISFQNNFQALECDVILASTPKSGTTWLQLLAFTIVNRHRFSLSNSPLNSWNPHDLLPYIEMTIYKNGSVPNLTNMSSPRLFSTHLPYHALAESIKSSDARIVYIIRNPLDVIVSLWHFLRGNLEPADWTLDECFEMYCRGEEGFGPFWDHALGYWKQSIEKPKKVLFLRYEEMKETPMDHTKKIAEFMGCPFSEEEEKAGAVEEITKFCSFSNLKNLQVNKNGSLKIEERQTKDCWKVFV